MNAPADSPRSIIVEWLRNSAICLVLIVVGAGVAGVIADGIGRDVPGAYLLGLMIGWYPAFWFISRYFKTPYRWWEYVGFATIVIALDVFCVWLQVAVRTRMYVVGPVSWLLLQTYQQHFRPMIASAPSESA